MNKDLTGFATFNNVWNCLGYHTETNERKNRCQFIQMGINKSNLCYSPNAIDNWTHGKA